MKFLVLLTIILLPFKSYAFCTSYTAESFGSAGYNGVYTENGTNNGVQAYENESGNWFYWQLSNNWLMSPVKGEDEGHQYYYPGDDETEPIGSWTLSGGSSPAGTLSQLDCSSGTTTATTTMTYKDWIFVEMVQTFLLSFIPLGMVWSIFKKEHS